jgi:hypothetical protein
MDRRRRTLVSARSSTISRELVVSNQGSPASPVLRGSGHTRFPLPGISTQPRRAAQYHHNPLLFSVCSWVKCIAVPVHVRCLDLSLRVGLPRARMDGEPMGLPVVSCGLQCDPVSPLASRTHHSRSASAFSGEWEGERAAEQSLRSTERECRTQRFTEWRPGCAPRRFGSRWRAAIGELMRSRD